MRVVRYLLIEEGLDVEGLHDVCVELREQEGVPDALVQQLPHLCRKEPMLALTRSGVRLGVCTCKITMLLGVLIFSVAQLLA